MTPVWMIEGAEVETDPLALPQVAVEGVESNGADTPLADRRLSALAAAIREHESASRRQAMPARPQDLTLYRRLRRICSQA